MQSRRAFLSSLAALSIAAGSYICWSRLRRRSEPELFAAIDALTQRLLRDSNVSAAQLAILREGATIFSKVYAEAPPAGFAAVTPQTLFRLASCSKMFTCAAITALQASGRLDLNQRVFPLLGITQPAIPTDQPDPRVDDITVQHLVDHAGGWNPRKSVQIRNGPYIPAYGFDPCFRMREVALELGLSAPPTKLELARYMYGKPLQFTPGTQNRKTTSGASYTNFGYVLLGLVVEAVAGESFLDFVRTLDGGDLRANVFVSPMLGTKNPREVWYDDPDVGLTALRPRADLKVPKPYGGGGFITDRMDSAAGLMTSAETLAQFGARHAAAGLGPRIPGSDLDGGMAGTASNLLSRPNGIDCALVMNTSRFRGGDETRERYARSLRRLLDQL